MDERKSLKDWIKNNGHKLKTVYSYAVVHKLDIASTDDILIVLHMIYPENANREQAELYSRMMQLFRYRFRKTVEENLEG